MNGSMTLQSDESGGTKRSIERMFGPDGALAKCLPGYEERPQQREMAIAISDALEGEYQLVVEAATGTGKTMAYLIPALESGKRIVVSTATKNLQDQLYHKDVPTLLEVLDRPISAVHLKGRSNYLCVYKYGSFALNPTFRQLEDKRYYEAVRRWAKTTTTGDRSEIDELPDRWPTWSDISATSESCSGNRCPDFEECFVTWNRRAAQKADLLIVNHHLYFADLVLKDLGVGEILPDHDAAVFDEAHHLEETATEFFGIEVSNYRINELFFDTRRFLRQHSLSTVETAEILAELRAAGDGFFSVFRDLTADGRYVLTPIMTGPRRELVLQQLTLVLAELDELDVVLKKLEAGYEESIDLRRRLGEIRSQLEDIVHQRLSGYVHYYEIRGRGVFLKADPIRVDEILREKLHPVEPVAIYTSATLATGGSFDYIEERLGLDEAHGPKSVLLPPVFDYRSQALLYVPADVPPPASAEFVKAIAQKIQELVLCARGRTFVLFTSYSNMQRVHDQIAGQIPFRVFVQGEQSRNALLSRFRRDVSSVLFATASFWEGVDVSGEALSQVIIDKLPFAVPNDPVVEARIDSLRTDGRNPFMEYQVPQAAISLRQGVGRLIRKHSDLGVLAIMDSRILRKQYGQFFLRSLPPAPLVHRLSDVTAWWRRWNET